MGSSGTLTDLTHAVIRSSVKTLNGQVVSRPALLVGDGKALVYACDVDVGVMSANGRIDQSVKYLYGIPGRRHYTVNNSLTVGTILRNVPIANNNGELRYADVGNAVTLTRTDSGTWQITGFSVELPGTRHLYAVDLGAMTLGPITNLSIVSRPLTLAELSTLGTGFGTTPLGAVGVFQGGELLEITI